MRKRNRNVVYALMYGAGKKTATKIFLRNKQNRRMPARLRKKELATFSNSTSTKRWYNIVNFKQNGDWITDMRPAKKGSAGSIIGNTIGFLIIVVPIVLIVIGHLTK